MLVLNNDETMECNLKSVSHICTKLCSGKIKKKKLTL